MESKRLPGKPLIDICGKPLLQWTYEQAKKTKADGVYVATGDEEIKKHCRANRIPLLVTEGYFPNGTARCAQVMLDLLSTEWYSKGEINVVVNWQVDEPLVDPNVVNEMFCSLYLHPLRISTLVARHCGWYHSNEVVKVIVSNENSTSKAECHWFTRNHIPYALYHCGVYAFRPRILKRILSLEVTSASAFESLEQLTWLEHGFSITPIVMHELPISINDPKDVRKLQNHLKDKL